MGLTNFVNHRVSVVALSSTEASPASPERLAYLSPLSSFRITPDALCRASQYYRVHENVLISLEIKRKNEVLWPKKM